MVKTIEAMFDGRTFQPTEPVDLAPDTLVRMTIETVAERPVAPRSFLATARSLNLDGPPDWSERFHEYLYGLDSAHAAPSGNLA